MTNQISQGNATTDFRQSLLCHKRHELEK